MKQLFTALLIFFSLAAQAQSWQWGKRGGSSDGSNSGPEEEVIDMTTDKQGNVYMLARTHQNGITVDGLPVTGIGRGNMVIGSWSCSGTRRWVKYIGSYDGNSAQSIAVDTLGGVYIAGALRSQNSFGYFRVGTDTIFTSPTYKSMFLLKLDTAGSYKWIRMPQADTVTVWVGSQKTGVIDMVVENNGTVHLFSQMLPGAYNNGALAINSLGLHMLRYDRNGSYLNNIPLQIAIPATGVGNIGLSRDFRNGRYYFTGMAGNGGTSFGGNPANTGFFVTAYNAQGQFIWFRQNTAQYPNVGKRAAIDNNGSVYITGATYPGDVFNGYTFTNPSSALPHGFPFLVKLDSNGNNLWATNGQVNAGTGAASVAVSGSAVAITGGHPGLLKFGIYQVSNMPNAGYDVFLARFNAATGAPLGIDSLESLFGYQEGSQAVIADRQGNFYVGGTMDAQLNVPGQSPLISNGGESDWFVAKFGTNNCGCTVPVASYGKTMGPARTVTFTYFGVPTGLDSLVWEWGDGLRLKVTGNYAAAVTHTYGGAAANFTACVTAYNSCGVSNQSCQTIQFTTDVNGLAGLGSVSVYPNPTSSLLTIEGAETGTTYDVLSLVGQRVLQGSVSGGNHTLSLESLPPGTYLLVMISKDGARGSVRISKQ